MSLSLHMRVFGYIYLITNNLNSKQYIGQHKTYNMDDGYMGSGQALHKAYKKYGKENFTKEILFYTVSNSKENLLIVLNVLEKFYIKKYNTYYDGYNLTFGGDGTLGFEAWNKGVKGIHLSVDTEFKKGIIPHNKGKHLSETTKNKLREYNKLNPNSGVFKKGHTPSYETKSKIAAKKQYINEKGETVWMRPSNVKRFHPDWKLIE